MKEAQRSSYDRRSGNDRRKAYALDPHEEEILDRRKGAERRTENERRSHWTRYSRWLSVPFRDARQSQNGGIGYALVEKKLEELKETIFAILDDGIKLLSDRITNNVIRTDAGTAPVHDVQRLTNTLSNLVTHYEQCLLHGPRGWWKDIDAATLEHAKVVMTMLIDIPTADEKIKGMEEQPCTVCGGMHGNEIVVSSMRTENKQSENRKQAIGK